MSHNRARPPRPFQHGAFADGFAVVVQRTVADGTEPARAVVHDAQGVWMVSDEVNDPNGIDAAIVVCVHCLVELDPSIGPLATMRPGTVAWRDERRYPWSFQDHVYPDD